MKCRWIKYLLIVLLLFSGINTVFSQTSGKQFPWRKKWNRFQLYRMSIFYFEAGEAYEKKNKNSTAMHCYLHAANTSPFSDVGAKAREKLRTKYNRNLHEPTLAERVEWLKKQPDLNQDEKDFIAQYERGGQQPEGQTTTPAQPEGQTTTPAQPGTQTTPQSGADNNISDDEIRSRGERVRYRDDASPSGN